MAADVSSLVRLINRGVDADETGKSTAPITRDLLGGDCSLDTQELDLDLQVPSGWEKRLDLKSGRVYLQRCSSENNTTQSTSKFQDLNFPPIHTHLVEHPSLDLKLDSLSSPSSNYQSVCTLDKVKSALARVVKETPGSKRSSSLSNSIKDDGNNLDQEHYNPIAARCPSCLLYVLIPRNQPRCPCCNTDIPLPLPAKKPRIDLNISI